MVMLARVHLLKYEDNRLHVMPVEDTVNFEPMQGQVGLTR